MPLYKCKFPFIQTDPPIYPHGVVIMPRNFFNQFQQHFDNYRFTLFTPQKDNYIDVRVLEWANPSIPGPIYFLNLYKFTDEWQMELGDHLEVKIDTRHGAFIGIAKDEFGEDKPNPPPQPPNDDNPHEIVYVDQPSTTIWYNPERTRFGQAIRKTFIDAAELQNAEHLHLKVRHSNKRWIVRLNKRRRKSFIYELMEGWHDFVTGCPFIQPWMVYHVYSKNEENFTLVFER